MKKYVNVLLMVIILVSCNAYALKRPLSKSETAMLNLEEKEPQKYTYTINSTVPDVQISIGGEMTIGAVINDAITSDNVDSIRFEFSGGETYVIPKEKLNRNLFIDVSKGVNLAGDQGYRITISENKEEFFVPMVVKEQLVQTKKEDK